MVKITVGTGYSGNWYSIVGTVSEVRDELNRKNVTTDKIVVVGDNGSGVFTLIVGSK